MKFRQTEWMFMDLTILASFSPIRQSEINLAKLTILTNFSPIRQSELWTYRIRAWGKLCEVSDTIQWQCKRSIHKLLVNYGKNNQEWQSKKRINTYAND